MKKSLILAGVFLAVALAIFLLSLKEKPIALKRMKFLQKGTESFEKGNMQTASLSLEERLQMFRKANDRENIAMTLAKLGLLHKENNEYNKALEYFNESLKLYKEMGSQKDVSANLRNLGEIHLEIKQYNEALNYFNKALAISKEINDKEEAARDLYYIGVTYQGMGNVDKVKEYFDKAERISEGFTRKCSSDTVIKKELEKLPLGKVLFAVPVQMTEGKSEKVEVRISEAIPRGFFENIEKNASLQIEEGKIGRFMKVKLTGNNFDIKALNSEEQTIPPEDFASWQWTVTPVKSGIQALFFTVTLSIRIPNQKDIVRDYPVIEKRIRVKVKISLLLKKLIAYGTAVSAAIVGIFNLWLAWQRYKQEKKKQKCEGLKER